MKTKYERMSKEEKQKVYKSFKEEKQDLVKKMNRMFVLVYFGIVYGFSTFFYDFFVAKSKLNYWLDIIVFIFCLIVLLILFRLKKSLLNKYVIKNKKRF